MSNDAHLEQLARLRERIDDAALCQARDYGARAGLSFATALVRLNILDYARVGGLLAELYGLPYHPLLKKAPSYEARQLVPQNVAQQWKLFPIGFDARSNTLCIAVEDPTRHEVRELLESWVIAPRRLSLSVACNDEIEAAINAFYRATPWIPPATLAIPDDFVILSSDEQQESITLDEDAMDGKNQVLVLDSNIARGRAVRSLLICERSAQVKLVSSVQEAATVLAQGRFTSLLISSRAFPEGGAWRTSLPGAESLPPIVYYHNLTPLLLGQEFTYQQTRQAIMRLVKLGVREHLRNSPEQFKVTIVLQRYCHLLALHLGLMPSEVDRLSLAAWLSPSSLPHHWREAVDTPYRVSELIGPTRLVADDSDTVSLILGVVGQYLKIQTGYRIPPKDAESIRKALGSEQYSPAAQRIVEALIKILKDEQLLSGLDALTARLLVVDPTFSERSALYLRLVNEGYEVTIVADAKAAVDTLSRKGFDLVLSETELGEIGGIALCRALRHNARTAKIPFMFLSSAESKHLMTEALSCGADDFLDKNVDPAVVILKIQRLLAQRPSQLAEGVKGTLAEMSLTDMLQILSSGAKSVLIRVSHGERAGELYMHNGEIVHAHFSGHEGEQAFYRIMKFTEGEFLIAACSAFPHRTISLSVMALLMEGARMEDEDSRGDQG